MLSNSSGYIDNISFFNRWSLQWTDRCHPGRALQAARRSECPPNESALWKWCRLHYPDLLSFFWPLGEPDTAQGHAASQLLDLYSMD